MQILQNVWTALTTENEGLVSILTIPLSFIEAYIFILLFKIVSTNKQKILYITIFSIIGCIIRSCLPDPYSNYLNINYINF